MACRSAFVISSETTSSASSDTAVMPQPSSVALVKFRAVFTDSGRGTRVQLASGCGTRDARPWQRACHGTVPASRQS